MCLSGLEMDGNRIFKIDGKHDLLTIFFFQRTKTAQCVYRGLKWVET